jgi:hypothetical protein
MSLAGTSFDEDLRDVHLSYDYDAHDAKGNPEKWRYELWFFSEVRLRDCFSHKIKFLIVYSGSRCIQDPRRSYGRAE